MPAQYSSPEETPATQNAAMNSGRPEMGNAVCTRNHAISTSAQRVKMFGKRRSLSQAMGVVSWMKSGWGWKTRGRLPTGF